MHTPKPSPRIVPLVVEMGSLASIHEFIRDLNQHIKHLDHAIVSASNILGSYECVDTSYEFRLQINAISPFLLTIQLSPFLLASPLARNKAILRVRI